MTDPDGLPLPGVVVTLTKTGEDSTDSPPLASVVTDDSGEYGFDVIAGQYSLSAELSGFQLVRKTLVVQSDVLTVDVSLPLASFEDSVVVTADSLQSSLLPAAEPNAPVVISRRVFSSAMLPNSRYEDVLTLMPNVERGPDNRISIAGAPAAAGALVVNGFNETDPARGLPGVVVPIDAVDAVEVRTGGYSADLGRASGGVTSIQTRAGANEFHTSVDSIFPRLLFENGSIHGVEYWEPNVGASGPIIKGRLFFEQAVSYRLDRYRFTTLAGPERSTYRQPLVWSQLDGNLSSGNRVRFALAFDQQHTDHAGITAFTPDSSVPTLAEDGWSMMVSDRQILARSATLEVNASLLNTDASAEPAGSGPYFLGHRLSEGGYFDDQSRRGKRIQGGATLTLMPTGRQALKIGVTVDRATLTGRDDAATVSFLRADGTVARTVSFQPAASYRVSADEEGAFVQDTWNPAVWFVLDGGIRYDRTSGVRGDMVSPRMAWTLKRPDGRSSVSGSVGLFVDKAVLSALAFPAFPGRIVQDVDLAAPAPPVFLANSVDDDLRAPHALRWDIGFDHTFSSFQLHARYQERHGADELILQPSTTASGFSTLSLSSNGRSTEKSLETTVGYRRESSGHEFYVSYVRSSARGDVNTFDAVEGMLKDPLVQPNQFGTLPTALPNRLLAWGLLRLPGGVTFAPFVSMRNGFPYTAIDDGWLYVGQRNAWRMPWFSSLDLSVTRIVDLPRQLPHARVGLKLYNLLSTNTEREIQRDIDSAEFGARYDPVPRDFSVVCVFLLGQR